jgi:hypothetical protein
MIFPLYIFLFSLFVVLLFWAYFSGNDIFKVTCFGLIFMLGVMLIDPSFFGSVDYCDHVIADKELFYSYNGSELVGVTESFSYMTVCDSLSSRVFGFWIAVLGVFGFVSVWFERKNGGVF